jgi:hypothetical protein
MLIRFGATIGGIALLLGFDAILTRHAWLDGARRGLTAVSIEVMATADVSLGPLPRCASCIARRSLNAGRAERWLTSPFDVL